MLDQPLSPRVAVFCKTFRDDFERLSALLASYDALAPIDVPFLLSVPEEDLNLLRNQIFIPKNVTVIADEDYVKGHKCDYGWLEQQVCKLSVYKTGFADAYISIDSDAYFIKPPSSDLCYVNMQPALVSSKVFTKWEEWNSPLCEYINFDHCSSSYHISLTDGGLEGFGQRLSHLRESIESKQLIPEQRGKFIRELFEAGELATQPSQILHASILSRLDDFLASHGMTLRDAIKLSPWEYDWYARFAGADPDIAATGIVSPVLHFASDSAIAHSKSCGVTLDKIRNKFIAIQMAARHFDTRNF